MAGFDGYEVSDEGEVFSHKTWHGTAGRILAASTANGGYPAVNLRRNDGRQVTLLVHALVAEAFIGPRPDGHDVAHLDGGRANNQVGNLTYATRAENNQHKIAHGTSLRGEENPKAKLTQADVLAIREQAAQGIFQSQIAATFDISQPHVSDIVSGDRWGWL